MKPIKNLFIWSAVLVAFAGAYPASAFYNPSTGQWLSRDPIGERGGKALHCIVRNDPVNRNDPLGLKETIKVKYGEFVVDMKPSLTEVRGTIAFKPSNCPECKTVNLVQAVQIFEKPGKDYVWPKNDSESLAENSRILRGHCAKTAARVVSRCVYSPGAGRQTCQRRPFAAARDTTPFGRGSQRKGGPCQAARRSVSEHARSRASSSRPMTCRLSLSPPNPTYRR